MFFKSQKSNGFNLKKLELETFILLKIYTALFVLLGFDLVFLQLTILKIMLMLKIILILDILKITKNGKPIRILSIFNLGLTIFRRCFNSYINYKIKTNMQLYLWLIQNFSFTFYVKLSFNTFCHEKNCNKISFLKNIAVFYIQIYQNQPKLIYQ